ncbi:LysE family translocator [Vibrio sp. D420a]|uniref:LysE family translocator n=1 Tax=Vibrio sp. D420a TaxID=2836895 RepID=UPI0025559593|nr:LysE family translocator [Vibrio sp. D420a]MDK9764721.1 LysE family translocator [Vibrio sp. D420a]
MEPQIFMAFVVFSISMSLTPGAGNLMLLSISNRYGFLAALPFVIGTTLGVMFVFIGSSAGLYRLLLSSPELYIAVKYAGAAYLLYTAWGITKQEIAESQETERTSGVTSGILIQVLNPKAWIAAMTIFSQFTDATGDYVLQVSILIFIFVLVTALCTLVWAYSGTLLKHALKSTHQMLIVNRCLGLTLAATVVYMLCQS